MPNWTMSNPDIFTSSCNNGIPTIVQEKANAKNKTLRGLLSFSTISTEPPLVDTSLTDSPGRYCVRLKCGQSLSATESIFYNDQSPNGGVYIAWSGSIYGVAYFMSKLESSGDLVTTQPIQLSGGVILFSLLHQSSAYHGTDVMQYSPIYLSTTSIIDSENNACCLSKQTSSNTIFSTITQVSANCSNTSLITQMILRPMPTYTEEIMQKRFSIIYIIGLCGGSLAFIRMTSYLLISSLFKIQHYIVAKCLTKGIAFHAQEVNVVATT